MIIFRNVPILLLCTCLLTSCAEKKVLEDIGLITTVGYDPSNNQKITSTVVVLQIDPDAARNIDVITTDALTSKGGRINGNLKTSKVLESGQLRVALYNEILARRGIKPYADTLARDPSISDLTYLGIVEGSTKNLLKYEYQNIPDIGQHLYNEIQQLTDKEQISNATLQEVQQSYYSEGIDPILPLLKRDGQQIRVSGNAIMRNDKMVGKLKTQQGFFVKLIRDGYRSGSVELTFNMRDNNNKKHKITAVIDTIKSSRKINLTDKKGPVFDIDLNIQGSLLELQGQIDLVNPNNIRLLELAISEKVKKELEYVISYCQKHNSDVFGFGEVYRSSVRHSNLSKGEWHKKYKKATYKIKVNFSLLRTGVTE